MSATPLPLPMITSGPADGPVTRARKRRLRVFYVACAAIGLLPWLLEGPPFWRGAGLGLLFPGAGFLAAGGWALVLLPMSMALFLVALFAWFAAGMVIAPPLVWGGAALLAGAMTGDEPWSFAPLAALVLLGAWSLRHHLKQRRLLEAQWAKREQRQAYLPAAMIEVAERAVPRPAADEHELSEAQVAHSRLLLQRALQPVGELAGFDRIDQFQTASLRYQLNFLGYALALMQSQYTPNFHGYLSEAQRRLIDQYLQRPIWRYWRLENLWGNLRYNPDPVGKDNIMLTAYLAQQVGMYMLASGDRRYAEPGSLTFRWNDRVAYAHDLHTLHRSLTWNFDHSPFCLFPCEPNWIYTGCNFFGLRALAAYDRLFGTDTLFRIAPRFTEQFLAEFTNAAGSVVSLRSTLAGFTAPFPGGDAGSVQALGLISPSLAQRFWAQARHDMGPLIREVDGRPTFQLPGKGLDFGNYRRGFTGIYGGLLMQSREIGDATFSSALVNALQKDGHPTRDADGVLTYAGSNMANAVVFLGTLMQRDSYREALTVGPPAEALRGPLLTDAAYPEVLVAKARSHGDDLDLVLYPGRTDGQHKLTVARLQADRLYAVSGATEPRIRADAHGTCRLSVPLHGRTEVRLQPL